MGQLTTDAGEVGTGPSPGGRLAPMDCAGCVQVRRGCSLAQAAGARVPQCAMADLLRWAALGVRQESARSVL